MSAVFAEEVCRIAIVCLGFCPRERSGGKSNWHLASDSPALPSLLALSPPAQGAQVRGESRLSVFPLEPLSHRLWARRV